MTREKRTESVEAAGKRARLNPQDAIGEVVDLELLEHTPTLEEWARRSRLETRHLLKRAKARAAGKAP